MEKIVEDLSVLRKKSEPVASVEEATGLISRLIDVLKEKPNGIGLAAIQIGVAKSIAVLRVGTDEKGDSRYINLINPELEEKSDDIIFLSEGCLSMPNYFQDTNRYRQITIKNNVIDGDKFREERQVFHYPKGNDDNFSKDDPVTCIAIQHELDHFDGKLITDNIVKRQPIVGIKKVGRNEPCPCGSKKKYKKCCGK